VRLDGGVGFRLVCNPTSYLAKIIYWNGPAAFEPHLYEVFERLVGHARGFVDVGANIGYYSLLATALNADIRVWSFEPLPPVAEYLRRNKVENDLTNMDVVEMAASDQTGTAEFTAARNEKFPFVAQHLTSTGSLTAEQASRTNLIDNHTVRCTTLDDFFGRLHDNEQDSGLDLLKIDVEANEHRVLDGARKVIATYRPVIVCEVLRGRIESEIKKRIESMDYVAFSPGAGRLNPIGSWDSPGRADDLIMVPRERVTEVLSWFV
jgi:FkbM family methyltransferase